MSENYELIAAANLPTTDAKEVDVICVEGGELKRKPGASIGGGGGGGYVINLDPSVDIFNEEVGGYMMSGSYDDFMPILYAGGSVFVNIFKLIEEEFPAGTVLCGAVNAFTFVPGMALELSAANPIDPGNSLHLAYTNGTWTPPTA